MDRRPPFDRCAAQRALRLAAAGALALLSGWLVYAGRGGPPAPWVPGAGRWAGVPGLHVLPGWWPSLAHALAFALFTLALLPRGRAWRRSGCLGWAATNLLFELGQHPRVAPALAAWLGHAVGAWPAGLNLPRYFTQGRFDAADLAAALAGAWVAALLARHIDHATTAGSTPHDALRH